MKRVNNATVLEGVDGLTVLRPGRKYQIDIGAAILHNCEFVEYNYGENQLFFLIGHVEVWMKASLIASIEEVSECNTTDN